MPEIRRTRHPEVIQVEEGVNLMQALQNAGVAVASSCAGDAVCGKCVLKIVAGESNLSTPTPDELFLIEKDRIKPGFRISCQCQVLGNIEVDAAYW